MIRRIAVLSAFGALLLSACKPHPPSPPSVENLKITHDGKDIEVVLSVPSDGYYAVFRCPSGETFDTLLIDASMIHDGMVTYYVDSTFLLACESHDQMKIDIKKSDEIHPWVIDLSSTLTFSADTPFIILDGKDTISLRRDSSGYVVRTGEYVRVLKYAGGVYAPLPPTGYDTLLSAGYNDTLVAWVDYDRDGVTGYDDGDVFWVILLGDSISGRTITTVSRTDTLLGYRGLDLCFKCTR